MKSMEKFFMIKIPPILIEYLNSFGPHFIRVEKQGKEPIDQGWNTNPLSANDSRLQGWLDGGGNYGVIGGFGLVIVDIDLDELKHLAEEKLPKTFTVQSPGSKGWHLYYVSSLEKPIRLRDKDGENIGDIQGPGKMVVGPSCIHPNGEIYEIIDDRPLAQTTREQLIEAFKEFVVSDREIDQVEALARTERKDSKIDLDICTVVPLGGLHKRGNEYYGPHPIHNSKTGQNFWVNPSKNCWHCFRHGTGGGPLLWLAVEEGIVDCSEAGPGAIRGEAFKQVLEKAKERGLIKDEKPKAKKEKAEENSRERIISFFDENYKFYCDRFDPDLTLYVWVDDAWQPIAEGIFLKHLSELEEIFKERPIITKDGLMDYFRGRGQNTEVTEKPPTMIAFKNGLYNLETGQLEPHTPQYFVVTLIPFNYNSKAEYHNWLRFLNEVHYEDDLDFIQEWWGFNLLTCYSAKAFVVMIGAGDNGKSVELTAIQNVLGHKNVTNVTLQNLNNPNGYHLATLFHKLANIADDIPTSKIRLSGNLKIASDGGWLNARPIYGRPFDFQNYAKITNSCNEPPEIEDESEAVWLRMKIVEFPYTFKAKPDVEKGERQAKSRDALDKELADEAEGILYWMVKGLHRLIQNKYRFSYNVSTETISIWYKVKSNPIAYFVDTCMEYTADEDDKIMKKDLYPQFKTWCNTQGLKIIPSSQKFFKFLANAGIEAAQLREFDRERVYIGYICHNVTSIQIHVNKFGQTKL